MTERTITFTLQFKKEMLAGLQKGKSAKIIMKELGYDPGVLGESRISGIAYHLIKEAESPEGLHEGRYKPKVVKPVTEDELAAYPPSHSLHRLQAEVSYLRQEVEFLKKIIQTGTGKKQGK